MHRMHISCNKCPDCIQKAISRSPQQRHRCQHHKSCQLYRINSTTRWFMVCIFYLFFIQILLKKKFAITTEILERNNSIYYCIVISPRFHDNIVFVCLLNRYGSWAVCFTHGTWFGVTGLIAAGKTYESNVSLRKACDFLLSKELPSGGWGESYLSCPDKVLVYKLPHNSQILYPYICFVSYSLYAVQKCELELKYNTCEDGIKESVNQMMVWCL